MPIRLWPVLPKDDEDNGLTRVEQMFVRDPGAEIIVVGRLGRRGLNVDDNNDGEQTPTLKFLAIEPVLVEADAKLASDLLQGAFRKRTAAGTLDEFADETNDQSDDGAMIDRNFDRVTDASTDLGDDPDGDKDDQGDDSEGSTSPRFLSAVPADDDDTDGE